MILAQHRLKIKTTGRGMIEVTDQLNHFIDTSNISTGLLHVFVQHTSASILICENADMQVQHDLETFMLRVTPDNDPDFKHDAEGPDDMPAHVRTMLSQSFLTLPITNKKLALGQWQSIYLWEHRLLGRERTMVLTIQGL